MESNRYEHWTLEVQEKIAYLSLNRPQQKNRIDNTTLSELGAITHIIADNSDIWVVVLRAEGDCFSAGVDVSLIGAMMNQDTQKYRDNLRQAQSYLDAFEALNKPTIAALHGYVIGGGLILSLCCDFRIAATDTIIGLPEVKRSIGVIMGTQRITRTIGVAHTKELAMIGDPVDVQRGFQMGLFNQLVPKQELDEHVNKLANRLLQLPPLAVSLNKKIINEGIYLERSGQDLEIEAQEELLQTEDFREAISSFVEKRPPNYKGQ